MKSLKSNLRSTFCAIAIAGLLLSAAAPIQALQEMQNMPGMKMGKARSKPKSKSTTHQRSRTRARGGMRGMSMKRMTMPATSRAASRSRKAPARKMNMNMPAMTGMPAQTPKAVPSASPEQMNMQGMQMPTTSPSPGGNNPTSNESPKHDMQNMPGMNMGNTTTQPSPAQTNSMPGMEMSVQGNNNQST